MRALQVVVPARGVVVDVGEVGSLGWVGRVVQGVGGEGIEGFEGTEAEGDLGPVRFERRGPRLVAESKSALATSSPRFLTL